MKQDRKVVKQFVRKGIFSAFFLMIAFSCKEQNKVNQAFPRSQIASSNDKPLLGSENEGVSDAKTPPSNPPQSNHQPLSTDQADRFLNVRTLAASLSVGEPI